jgi:antitoxin ParD1/3/4
MATMNISLPEPLREFVEDQVERGGYSSVSEYMRELVRKAKNEKDVELKLLEAIRSEDLGEVGPELFARLRTHARRVPKKARR